MDKNRIVMLNKIIKFSLNNKLLILVASVVLIVAGTYTTQKMDVDVFPDLTAPTVVVMTDAHGMAAEEVERLVTFPIETAVNGATNVRRVRSASLQGSSFVWVEFDWGMDVFRARQIVSEKMVTLTGSLPEEVTPVLAPQSSVMGEILFIGLQADSTSMMELRTLAEWVVKPAILATGGVSQVTIIGGDYKQYQILADPIRMAAYDVTMDDLEAVGSTISKNSTGSVVRDYGNEYALRGMARTNDLEELGQTFVKSFNIFYSYILGVAGTASIGKSVSRESVKVFFLNYTLKRANDTNILCKLANSLNSCSAVLVLRHLFNAFNTHSDSDIAVFCTGSFGIVSHNSG